MKNLLFFLWLLLFPMTDEVSWWVKWKVFQRPLAQDDLDEMGIAILLTLVIYFGVAYLLYNQ